MKITAVKTHKITTKDRDILKILDKYLPAGRQGLTTLQERSIVVITSKIISICQGRVVKIGEIDKDELIKQESQYYLPRNINKYNVSLTITRNTLVPTAGIDESNGNGYYILWPKNPQKTANRIRLRLKSRFNLDKVGVIITDSKTTPLRWGVTAIAIAYSGFTPLKNYIGKKDLFGRPFIFEQLSVIDSLASAATVVMGEGAEQTPIAIITDLPNIKFQERDPTKKELNSLKINKNTDLYSPLLSGAHWKKGKSR